MKTAWLAIVNRPRWTLGIAIVLIGYLLITPLAHYGFNVAAVNYASLSPLELSVLDSLLNIFRPAVWLRYHSRFYWILWELENQGMVWVFDYDPGPELVKQASSR